LAWPPSPLPEPASGSGNAETGREGRTAASSRQALELATPRSTNPSPLPAIADRGTDQHLPGASLDHHPSHQVHPTPATLFPWNSTSPSCTPTRMSMPGGTTRLPPPVPHGVGASKRARNPSRRCSPPGHKGLPARPGSTRGGGPATQPQPHPKAPAGGQLIPRGW
jgi:hypothetical protein